MNILRLFALFAATVSLLCSALAMADSAPVSHTGIDGSNVVLTANRQIRMVKEIVNIECAWTTYSVQADFWFKNTTTHTLQVEMGFPIDFHPIDADWHTEENKEGILQKSRKTIKVLWQGQPVHYKVAKLQQGDRSGEQRQWISWNAKLAPHEEVQHRISYTFPMFHSSWGSQGNEPSANLTYILKTGAAWRGPIDSAIVSIHYARELPDFFGGGPENPMIVAPSNLTISPPGYRWDKQAQIITWTLRNFVPSENIHLCWRKPSEWAASLTATVIGTLLVLIMLIEAVVGTIVCLWVKRRRRRAFIASQH